MQFPTPLVPATLIKRYKRFLADCHLESGEAITAHCANPGSMMGLAEPGTRIWLEPNNDPKKKLKYGWRLVDHGDGRLTGVDTSIPNKVLRAAFEAQAVAPFSAYTNVRPEVRYGQNSRIDFLLTQDGLPDAYVEVKSVTLCREKGLAEFPDSVTSRGTKHLRDLVAMVQAGHRAAMLYFVQRNDCDRFDIARDIDPTYAQAFATARTAGVEILCLSASITTRDISVEPIAVKVINTLT